MNFKSLCPKCGLEMSSSRQAIDAQLVCPNCDRLLETSRRVKDDVVRRPTIRSDMFWLASILNGAAAAHILSQTILQLVQYNPYYDEYGFGFSTIGFGFCLFVICLAAGFASHSKRRYYESHAPPFPTHVWFRFKEIALICWSLWSTVGLFVWSVRLLSR